MIEKIVRDYLIEQIEVPIYTEIPLTPPESYVVIEKTGSSRENFISHSTIVVDSYAESLYKATLLNEEIKTALLGDGTSYDNGIAGVVKEVSACDLNTDHNATDTTNKKHRYQAVYDLVHF